jgi:hypothetical protein
MSRVMPCSAKPMVGVYPEWGRAGLLMTYPATSWTAFAMRARMSRNPCWHQARQSPDRAGEQAYLRDQSQNRESARHYRSPRHCCRSPTTCRMSRSLPKLARLRHADLVKQCPCSEVHRKTFAQALLILTPFQTSRGGLTTTTRVLLTRNG